MKCSEFSQLIDLYLDGELDDMARAQFEKHAETCEGCRSELNAARKLMDILSHLDDNVAVPLPAQAAWRGAVKKEAAQRRVKRVIRAAGAVAAALVLTLGVTAMVRGGGLRAQPVEQTVTMVAADGVSEAATIAPETMMMTKRGMPAAYSERTVVCTDAEEARGYVMDIIAEYGGLVENESEDTDAVRIYVQIPGENAQDFITAVDHVGNSAEGTSFDADAGAASVGICVVISEEIE